MIRQVLQRLLVAWIRFVAAAFGLLLLMEFSFVVLGGSDRHVWQADSYGPLPPEFAGASRDWGDLLRDRGIATGRVLLVAIPAVWLVGYTWGVLGARLRRYRAVSLLAAPFAAFACAPGFWVVVLVAIHSYFHWQRPGFADDLVWEGGPDLLPWWHATVVALPATAAGIAWQIRAAAGVLEREGSRPWVRGLFVEGANDEEIFYGRVLRRTAPALAALFDRPLPALLGSLVVLETAFRYPGVGALLVDAVRLQSHAGVLLGSLSFVVLATLAALFRELIAPVAPPS